MLGFHRNRFLVLASLVPLTALTVAMGRAAPTAPTPASPPAIENKDASWFVAKVKSIVDAGELFYPEQIERTLGLQMQRTDKERIAQPPDCSGASTKRSLISTDFTIANNWFKSGPGGVPHMKVPRAFINPASDVGEPEIAYKIFETAYCSGERDVLHRTEAVLSFGNLSGFACLTPSGLATQINAEHIQATDGVSISRYTAPGSDLHRTSVDFIFRAGAPCAVAARIEQDSRFGNRQLRAEAKYRSCARAFIRSFCATRPNLILTNLDKLKEDEIKTCGPLESFFENETLTGVPPPPEPKRDPSGLLCPEK